MKPEEINIAIAEACGWKRAGGGILNGCESPGGEWFDRTIPYKQSIAKRCPDFYNDLNAMSGAMKSLDPHDRNDFIANLWEVTGNEALSPNFWTEYNMRAFYACINATAAQRAEAFLKTIGKWKE